MKIHKTSDSFLFKNIQKDSAKNNKSRIYSYDIMRGLAVVFMILIHVMHVYAKPYVEHSVLGYAIEFLGGPPAAPTFMILMGIFFVYSNKGNTRASLLRGLNILLVAFALNLVRGIVPYYVLTELKGISLENLGAYFRMEFIIFEVDILTFAGFAYMIMTLLYHYFKKPIVWLVLAVAIAVGSPFLWQIQVTKLPLQYITNVFWGDEYLSVFPLFPWLTFPLVGMVVGRWLQVKEDQNKIINKLAVYSIFLIVTGGALILTNIDYFYNAYGKMGIGAIIAITGFVFLWQWLITKVYKLTTNKIKTGFLMFLSKHVMQVYFIHWVLCKWGVVFFGIDSLEYLGVFIMFVAVTALTLLLTWVYTKLNKSESTSRKKISSQGTEL